MSPAAADVVVLNNGVEIRNARIISESEHVVTLQIVGLTRLVLGKSEIKRIERGEFQPPSARPAAETVASPLPLPPVQKPLAAPVTEVPSLPAKGPGMTQILKVAAEQPGVILEFRLDISAETGVNCTVYPSDISPGAGSRTYTIATAGGKLINVMATWDSQGTVIDTIIAPPTPPVDASEDEYEYTVETIGGGKFKIRAIWDVLNSELVDINFLLL